MHRTARVIGRFTAAIAGDTELDTHSFYLDLRQKLLRRTNTCSQVETVTMNSWEYALLTVTVGGVPVIDRNELLELWILVDAWLRAQDEAKLVAA